MSAIDETWEHLGNHRVTIKGTRMSEVQVLGGGTHEEHADRAKLAACAPEALRLLLENEYEGPDGMCASCGASRHAGHPGGHHAGCKWVVLMKKAGLR